MTAPTFQGRACGNCNGTLRYAVSRRCVPCNRAAAIRSSRNRKEDTVETAIKQPDRKGWAYAHNADGDRVYPDPIVHLGLGDEGKFA